MKRHRRIVGAVVASAIVVAACGSEDAGDGRAVSETSIRSEGAGEMSVWAPDDAEDLPVAFVLHGQANDRSDLAGFATALAREGHVVFVPDIRTGSTVTAATDVECGYHAALDAATDFGGDPERPVALVGWSFGAVTALFSGLDEEATGLRGLAEGCPLDAPRPEVIVSIAGCYTSWDGDSDPIDPAALGWTNKDAQVILIAGQLDPVCIPSESAEAADSFRAAGYEVEFIEVEGGDHGSMLFFPPEEYGSVDDPRGDSGEQSVQIITEAIEDAGS